MLLKLNYKNVVIVCLTSGLLLTVYAYFKDHETIKQQESQLCLKNKCLLYLNRLVHYSTTTFALLYPILMEGTIFQDFLYLFLFLLLFIHWKIFGECSMSIMEKQILDPSYIAGSDRRYEPYFRLIHDSDDFYNSIHFIENTILTFISLRLLYNLYNKKTSILRFILHR